MSRYKVLALTWRPKRFDDVVGQPHVVQSLSNAISLNKIPQCLLFTGTRGVGKTTIARILAKCLNCVEGPTEQPCQTCDHCLEIDAGRFPDLYEVDAASRTKVEDTRELLDNIPYSPTKGRYKVYLIDEVHMLSNHSFNALLKTLEEPPEHVVFLLATTDPQKLPATILSRCLQFRLQAMTPEQIDTHLQHILAEEKITFEADATKLIAHAAKGSMRDALSLLDQSIAFGNGAVAITPVKTMLGTIEPEPLYHILNAVADKNGQALLEQVSVLRQSGTDYEVALRELSALIQQISVLQIIDGADRNCPSAVKELATRFSAEETQLLYQIVLQGVRDLPYAANLETGLEMTLLRLMAFYPDNGETPPPTPQSTNKTITATKTKTATKQQSSAAAPSTSSPAASSGEWSQIVAQLPLRGLALVLAQNCKLTKKTADVWYLALERQKKPLLQSRSQQTISEALSNHLGSNINITIEITDNAVATTKQDNNNTAIDNNLKSSAPQPATVSAPIHQNSDIEKIIQTFSGTVDDNRVVFHNNSNSKTGGNNYG